VSDAGVRSAGVRGTVGAAWARLRGGEVTAWRAAASVAVGIFIGVTPLWGTHLLLVLAVCLPLRLDARVAYVAANVSLPFFAPFLTIAEIQLGALARTGATLPVDRAALHAHGLAAFAGDLAVGTALLAPSAAIVLGALTWFVVAAAPRRTELGVAIEKVARRFPPRGPRVRARAKLATDPVARAILGLGPLGEICDVGCGAGYLSLLALVTARATLVVGFDADTGAIALATAAGADLQARFFVGDARTADIAPCDTALLVDVLHYMAPEDQDALLARAAKAARQRVVVREIDRRPGLWSAITRLAERTRSAPHARGVAELAAVLGREGLRVRIEACDQGTPFANALLIAER
jgi:SAM-dependent methyltransferase